MNPFTHRVEYFFFSLFRQCLLLMPFPWVQRTGRFLGRSFYHLMPGRRAITLDNLRNAFPGSAESDLRAIAKGAFGNFGIAMSEFLCFSNLDRPALEGLLHYDENRPHFEAIARRGALVYLTGHFGNWELSGVGSAALAGVSYLVTVKTQANRLVDRVVTSLRCAFGNSVVPMDRAIRESLTALRNGGVVALAPDQSASRESDYIPFFGRDVATFRGPAAFALKAGVPVMMGFVIRRPDYTYDFVLEEVPGSDLIGATDDNVRELTRRHVNILERYVRLHPDHWLWMHRRWKHVGTPETLAGLASPEGTADSPGSAGGADAGS